MFMKKESIIASDRFFSTHTPNLKFHPQETQGYFCCK